jgi:hypothetical protein
MAGVLSVVVALREPHLIRMLPVLGRFDVSLRSRAIYIAEKGSAPFPFPFQWNVPLDQDDDPAKKTLVFCERAR